MTIRGLTNRELETIAWTMVDQRCNALGNSTAMNTARSLPDNVTHLLRINDPSLQALDLDEPRLVHASPSFVEFLGALGLNSTVKSVKVRPLLVQVTSEEQLNQLLGALGRMATLEELEVSLPHINDRRRFRGDSLNRFFRTAMKIRTLALWPFVLFTQESISDLSVSLRDHVSLQNLMLLNILFAAANVDSVTPDSSSSTSLDPFLDCLATLPNLEHVQLSAGVRITQAQHSPISVHALDDFVGRAAALVTLAVRNLGLGDVHCSRLAEKALQRHRNLKALDLRFNEITSVGWTTLHRMLEEIYCLHWLDCDLEEGHPLRTDWEFVLLLNRAGRYTLLKNSAATRDERIQVFARTEGCLDAVFVLLRSCPIVLDQICIQK